MNDATNEERLQKVLARAGIASRRACEELIAAGRVQVNGKIVTQLGTKINPAHDKILVDNHPVAVKPGSTPKKIYLMLNKPKGYLSTATDPQGRPTIMDLVEIEERLYPVGRLDADTEGLLILTNDGAFAQALTHPRFGVEKEYLALLDGRPPLKELERLRKGVKIPVENSETGELEEYLTQPAKVDLVGYEGSNTLVRFVIKEGKKRQVRLMARALGFSTLDLKRVRFGPIPLADLAEGKTRTLSKFEIKALLQAANGERVTLQTGPGKAGPRSGVSGQRPPIAAVRNRPKEERPPARRTANDKRQSPDRQTASDKHQPFDRRSANDKRQSPDRRTGSDERPTTRRTGSDERQPFNRKPNNDERQPFNRKPNNDERQPFNRKPNNDERQPFNRKPNNDERQPNRESDRRPSSQPPDKRSGPIGYRKRDEDGDGSGNRPHHPQRFGKGQGQEIPARRPTPTGFKKKPK